MRTKNYFQINQARDHANAPGAGRRVPATSGMSTVGGRLEYEPGTGKPCQASVSLISLIGVITGPAFLVCVAGHSLAALGLVLTLYVVSGAIGVLSFGLRDDKFKGGVLAPEDNSPVDFQIPKAA